jgi:hypothetical protein
VNGKQHQGTTAAHETIVTFLKLRFIGKNGEPVVMLLDLAELDLKDSIDGSRGGGCWWVSWVGLLA